MRTVQPCIIIGSYVWDQDRVPRDEFAIRIGALNQLMDANGWKAVLVYGDAAEHSALAWFSGFTTRLRWGMALIPREGEPRLLISMSPRDVPAMKLMTWIPDVVSGWNWESAFDPWPAKLNGEGAIGSVGFELMRPPLFASLQKSLDKSLDKSLGNRFSLQAADAAVAVARTLRTRERSQIRAASRLVQAAGATFVETWRLGKDVETAALAAERTARMMAAQDARPLVTSDGGRTRAPFRGAFEPQLDRQARMAGYIAVKHMGYWADLFVTGARRASEIERRAQAGLRTLVELAKPGASAAGLYAQAIEAFAPYT